MSWEILDDHHNFVPVWQLIKGIADIGGYDLRTATKYLCRLNPIDPIDGTRTLGFYGYTDFDGYFLAKDYEYDLCLDAFKMAIQRGTVKALSLGGSNQPYESELSLEDGFEQSKGFDFFLSKREVLKEIEFRNSVNPVQIQVPECLNLAVKHEAPIPPSSSRISDAAKVLIISRHEHQHGDVSKNYQRAADIMTAEVKVAGYVYEFNRDTVKRWKSDVSKLKLPAA
ncbi:hypothetical protein [Serratia sp. ASV30]|uniref:hypothetical protein n=1 Tax=Serratia sp. ASV30 TaxID=2795127 RepID=UPI0018EA4B3F|nr:hypothetical protein [Serratia sp. ASV30]